ncbi:hypothetical protein GN244_ATG12207 [Phytophthora infestans]|uniref:M96 mating-specific protein family n=1 Tax=Phytophthora infestans TaxID=4787 RepID=A0A833VZQ2_PHYIN|nr:hypothetical protein GN244_ATG12207 [Phytophthora infestans]
MSFALLEDDDEAFTEVLALLDEYTAAVEESPRAHSRSKHASPFSTLIESSAWTAFEAAHPITKTTSKHRNGAREMRRREVLFLRTCARGLETQLTALKEGAEKRAQLRNGALEDQKKVREMLQRALNTRVARRVMETKFSTRKTDQKSAWIASRTEFLERRHCHLIFRQPQKLRGGVWLTHFSRKSIISRTVERKKYDSGDVAHDDTVCESFGVEIKAPERMADFRIKQVFRRYREADRIVIAWRSYIDPAEFKGQKLEGFRFQEKGSCEIRHPHATKLLTASNEFTHLRIWHVITPESLANTNGTKNSFQFVQDLTDFVLGGSSSASTVQMIENMLIEQSRRNSAHCVV